MVFCTEFLDGWWSWEPLRRSCVRCGWCRALYWQDVTPVSHTINTAIQPVQNMTYAIHEFSYSCNVPACSTLRIFSRRLYGRKLIGCQFEERRRDIMTFHRHVKKATGHVKVVVARELQINLRDEGGCCSGHRTARYCRQNFTLAATNTGLEFRPSIKTKRMLK